MRWIQKISVTALVLCVSTVSHADTFKDSMKGMGQALKAVESSLKAAQISEQTLADAQKLVSACQTAMTSVPEMFAQDSAFKNKLSAACELNQKILQAITAKDGTLALTLVGEAKLGKDSAHDQYRQ